jgi:excinuclease ABC subunit A
MREVPCPSCHGTRLKPVSLAVTVDGRSIAEICALPIGELAKLLLALDLSGRADPQGGQRPARLPAGRGPGLPHPGPGLGHAGGR